MIFLINFEKPSNNKIKTNNHKEETCLKNLQERNNFRVDDKFIEEIKQHIRNPGLLDQGSELSLEDGARKQQRR